MNELKYDFIIINRTRYVNLNIDNTTREIYICTSITIYRPYDMDCVYSCAFIIYWRLRESMKLYYMYCYKVCLADWE